MKYLVFLLFIFGCNTVKPVEVAKPANIVTPQYVDLVSTLMKENTNQLIQVSNTVKSNTDILLEIKQLMETRPAEADAPETPSAQTKLASAGPPTLYVSSIEGCAPCRKLERDYKNGKFAPFTVVFRPDPNWEGGYPVIRWQEEGQWKAYGRLVKDSEGNEYVQSLGYDGTTIDKLKARFGL